MLKSVTNSLGGTFTLDYEHSTPTYGLPGGKWVMSSVTIDDGFRDDGPMMKTMFAYSDGQKDRHEREFLGFGKVVTKNIDTEQGESAVYRQAVQLYDVSTYYAQGNELGASVEDAKGNKYTETRNSPSRPSSVATAPLLSYRYAIPPISSMRDRQPASPPQRLGMSITSQAITES